MEGNEERQRLDRNILDCRSKELGLASTSLILEVRMARYSSENPA